MPTADATAPFIPAPASPAPATDDDDFLAGATACSVDGEDCEACQ